MAVDGREGRRQNRRKDRRQSSRKARGRISGSIVGVGIIAWDVWDHYSTVKENKPLLRENIFAFLDEMKLAVLDDPGTGVMSPVIPNRRPAEEFSGSVRKRA